MNNKWLIFFTVILFSSCIEEVVYEKVQPEGQKDETRFKAKFRGKYYDKEACYRLEVKKKTITEHLHIETTLHKSMLPKFELELKKEDNSTLDYKLIEKGDSILVKVDHEENIFTIGKNQKLRYYDGIYFLNYIDTNKLATENTLWYVKTLSKKNGELILGNLPAEEKYLEKLETIFPLSPIKDEEDETIGYKASPSKEHWREFIAKELYNVSKVYNKKKPKTSCNELVIDF